MDCQGISTIPLQYTFADQLLNGDTKAIINQAALDIGIHTVDYFNKVLLEMTKLAFLAYTFLQTKEVST